MEDGGAVMELSRETETGEELSERACLYVESIIQETPPHSQNQTPSDGEFLPPLPVSATPLPVSGSQSGHVQQALWRELLYMSEEISHLRQVSHCLATYERALNQLELENALLRNMEADLVERWEVAERAVRLARESRRQKDQEIRDLRQENQSLVQMVHSLRAACLEKDRCLVDWQDRWGGAPEGRERGVVAGPEAGGIRGMAGAGGLLEAGAGRPGCVGGGLVAGGGAGAGGVRLDVGEEERGMSPGHVCDEWTERGKDGGSGGKEECTTMPPPKLKGHSHPQDDPQDEMSEAGLGKGRCGYSLHLALYGGTGGEPSYQTQVPLSPEGPGVARACLLLRGLTVEVSRPGLTDAGTDQVVGLFGERLGELVESLRGGQEGEGEEEGGMEGQEGEMCRDGMENEEQEEEDLAAAIDEDCVSLQFTWDEDISLL